MQASTHRDKCGGSRVAGKHCLSGRRVADRRGGVTSRWQIQRSPPQSSSLPTASEKNRLMHALIILHSTLHVHSVVQYSTLRPLVIVCQLLPHAHKKEGNCSTDVGTSVAIFLRPWVNSVFIVVWFSFVCPVSAGMLGCKELVWPSF